MRDKNSFGIIVLVLLVICLLLLVALNVIILSDDTTVDNGEVDNGVILPLSADAGQEYVDSLYFVGDSTTYHFFKGGIDKSHLLLPSSFTLSLNSEICDVLVGDTNLTIPESIKANNAKYVIITLGVNGADRFSETAYKTYYNKLINAIKLSSPSTKIILQSAFPVTKDYSDKDNGISNEGINRLNGWLKEIAKEQGLPYLDTQSVLKGANGAMIEDYSEGDGVHMNAKAYKAILEYIRTHAYK